MWRVNSTLERKKTLITQDVRAHSCIVVRLLQEEGMTIVWFGVGRGAVAGGSVGLRQLLHKHEHSLSLISNADIAGIGTQKSKSIIKQKEGQNMKKLITTLITLIMVLVSAGLASANNIDFSIGNKYSSLTLNVSPDLGSVSVIYDTATQRQNVKTDYVGDMTKLGDYEIWNGDKSHMLMGFGYQIGETGLTPWIAIAGQAEKVTQYKMVMQESKFKNVKSDLTEYAKGIAVGIYLDKWFESLGASGAVVKMPQGVLTHARIKYNVSTLYTVHVGHAYNSYFGDQHLFAGVGIAY